MSMSLMRQLWLAVIVSTTVAFSGSLLISIWSARVYLAEQLERKNNDNANSLALSLTQQEKDPVWIDLQVAALFDTGYYQTISVVDTKGKVIAERVQDKSEGRVPDWFVGLFPIPSRPGVAQISSGWKQYGTVKIISHNQFAYKALWEQSARLILWFLVGGGLTGLFGTMVLRIIGRSLRDVVNQAGAIGERRFVTVPESRIPELGAVTRAMNGMVERIRQMFAEEAKRLEELQYRVNYDPLTGLPNRAYFMAYLKQQLTGDDAAQGGVLGLMRLPDLDELNERLGREQTDLLLRRIGGVFSAYTKTHQGALAGRTKAGDVAILMPGEQQAHGFATELGQLLRTELLSHYSAGEDLFHLGVVQFSRDQPLADILSEADEALALAENRGPNTWWSVERKSQSDSLPGEQWKTVLTKAVQGGGVKLAFYPVVWQKGGLLHQEGVIRLETERSNQLLPAGDFMPIAAHLHLTAPLDLAVIKRAIEAMAQMPSDIAVNLSAETVNNWTFRNDLAALLRAHPDICRRLWVEVPEYGALKHFDAFKDLCRSLKDLGCKVGVEHFGLCLTESQRFTELGIDYVKIDPMLIRGIDGNQGNQEFLRSFCRVAHTFGITVVAVGVQNQAEASTVTELGVDGVTGPAIS